MGDTISNFLGGGAPSGYEDMQKALQQGIGQAGAASRQAIGYLQPYEQLGFGALNKYMSGLSQMEDPAAYYRNIMSGYSESPMAKYQEQAGMKALTNQSAAAGMLGSGALRSSILRESQGISSQDMQSYLNNIMGVQGRYLSGMGGLGQMGFQAAGGQAQAALAPISAYSSMYPQLGAAQYGDHLPPGGTERECSLLAPRQKEQELRHARRE